MMKQRQDLDHSYLHGHFDRQVRIQSWNQKLLQSQTALILGVGGLGSICMIALLRLGIKKLLIVDYDVVDNHNMNRQLMFCIKDIGRSKIECAIKNSQFHNINNTIIDGFDGDALKNWQKIINFVKQSDVVFNCIDHGDKFDVAITSLCLKNKKPLIMGGTFATSLTVDYFGVQGLPCFLCTNDQAARQKQLIQKLLPDVIQSYQNILFIPKNNNPIGRSSTIVCTICGQFMVSQYLNYLFLSEEKPVKPIRLIAYHNTAEIVTFELQANRNCLFCGDKNGGKREVNVEGMGEKGIQIVSQGVQVDQEDLENNKNSLEQGKVSQDNVKANQTSQN